MSDELDRERREMHAVLQQPGVRPDDSVQITRRTFVHHLCYLAPPLSARPSRGGRL